MVQLQNDLKAIKASGLQVVGVSYDSVGILKTFSDKRKIAFPLLSDPKSKTIEAYLLRNATARKGSRNEGVPYPATIVIDTKGIVRANLSGTTRTRHSTKALLDAAKKLAE